MIFHPLHNHQNMFSSLKSDSLLMNCEFFRETSPFFLFLLKVTLFFCALSNRNWYFSWVRGLKATQWMVLSEMMLLHLVILLAMCFLVVCSCVYCRQRGRMCSLVPKMNLPLWNLMASKRLVICVPVIGSYMKISMCLGECWNWKRMRSLSSSLMRENWQSYISCLATKKYLSTSLASTYLPLQRDSMSNISLVDLKFTRSLYSMYSLSVSYISRILETMKENSYGASSEQFTFVLRKVLTMQLQMSSLSSKELSLEALRPSTQTRLMKKVFLPFSASLFSSSLTLIESLIRSRMSVPYLNTFFSILYYFLDQARLGSVKLLFLLWWQVSLILCSSSYRSWMVLNFLSLVLCFLRQFLEISSQMQSQALLIPQGAEERTNYRWFTSSTVSSSFLSSKQSWFLQWRKACLLLMKKRLVFLRLGSVGSSGSVPPLWQALLVLIAASQQQFYVQTHLGITH